MIDNALPAQLLDRMIEGLDKQNICVYTKSIFESERVLKSEQLVRAILDKYFKRVYSNVVVRSKKTLYVEIDFVTFSDDTVFIFEVKDWFGNLVVDELNHSYVELSRVNLKGRYTKEKRVNPIYSVSAFADDLRKTLKNIFHVDGLFNFQKYVIFTDSRLTIHGFENIKTSTQYVYIQDLDNALRSNKYITNLESIDWPDSLPSWDIFVTNGGKVFYSLVTSETIIINGDSLDIKDIDYIYFDHICKERSLIRSLDGSLKIGLIDYSQLKTSAMQKLDITTISFIKINVQTRTMFHGYSIHTKSL